MQVRTGVINKYVANIPVLGITSITVDYGRFVFLSSIRGFIWSDQDSGSGDKHYTV